MCLPVSQGDAWLMPFHPGAADLGLGAGWAPIWRLAALVRAVVARGGVAPHLGLAGGGRGVGWRLVPGHSERQALRALAQAILPESLPPGTDPEWLAAEFSRWYAAALIRGAVSRAPALVALRRVPRASRTMARRWLASLLAPAPRSLGAFTSGDTLEKWAADPLGLDVPPRLILQLDEPRPDKPDAWPLCVHVELPAEAGVMLHPSEVVADASRGGWGANPLVERSEIVTLRLLQHALQRAARSVPALSGIEDGSGDEVTLTATEAWRLLAEARPRLETEGVKLVVPAWWAHAPRPQPRLKLSTSDDRGLFGADQLVHFDWQVAVGDETLTPEAFDALVQRRTPFVRLQHGWAVLPPGAVQSVLQRWGDGPTRGAVGAGAALLMALQAEADGAGSSESAVLVDADEQVIAQLRALAAQPPELPEPEGFSGALRPYQRRGLAWLTARARLGLGGVLADDMGLGKTVQVLALLARRRGDGVKEPTLIVAPTSVVANWAAEAQRFTPGFTVVTHHGTGRARGAALANSVRGADVVLTSYPLLLRDIEALRDIDWDGVILDEAQNVKNAHAKQSQAARRLGARYRFALTGTPVENALADLWSIFTFVQPGYLGSGEAFRSRLALPIERGKDEAARLTLRRLIGPLILRRTKSEPGVADELPPRIETLERCLLTREQAALYEAVAQELLARVEESTGMQRKAAVLLALLRLKQVCNHPAHYAGDDRALADGSGKLERLEALLDEVVAEGERALIFTQFARWGRRLSAHLAERYARSAAVFCLDGSTPAVERASLVRRFQAAAGPALFVLSVKAGGAGLNLTAATHVFHYDRWWNPAVERQATDRAHRIGQQRTVHVHKLLSVGTLEERIDRLIGDKEALADGVLTASGEAWLTELDDGALREVLMLRRQAIG